MQDCSLSGWPLEQGEEGSRQEIGEKFHGKSIQDSPQNSTAWRNSQLYIHFDWGACLPPLHVLCDAGLNEA